MSGAGSRNERRLLEALELVLTASNLDQLSQAMMQACEHVIDADMISYNEVDTLNHRVVALIDNPDTAPYLDRHLEAFVAHIGEHPVAAHYQVAPDAGPMTISDFISLPAFRELGLYREFFRHLDVNHQLAINVGSMLDGNAAIALSRGGSDFDTHDRQVAARLQSAMRANYEALWLRETLTGLVAGADMDRQYRYYRMLGLTQRQAEVCAWLVIGKSNPEIATILDISAETVKQHAATIFERLGVPGRGGLQRTVLARMLRRGRAGNG